MRYAQLRRLLRQKGFINVEIAALHMQYLTVKAAGVDDEDIIFDRDHGLLLKDEAKATYEAMVGMKVAPDMANDCVYLMHDDGTATKLGPF